MHHTVEPTPVDVAGADPGLFGRPNARLRDEPDDKTAARGRRGLPKLLVLPTAERIAHFVIVESPEIIVLWMLSAGGASGNNPNPTMLSA
jgi:hypothetical protein